MNWKLLQIRIDWNWILCQMDIDTNCADVLSRNRASLFRCKIGCHRSFQIVFSWNHCCVSIYLQMAYQESTYTKSKKIRNIIITFELQHWQQIHVNSSEDADRVYFSRGRPWRGLSSKVFEINGRMKSLFDGYGKSNFGSCASLTIHIVHHWIIHFLDS